MLRAKRCSGAVQRLRIKVLGGEPDGPPSKVTDGGLENRHRAAPSRGREERGGRAPSTGRPGHPPSLLSSPFQLPARAGLQNRPVGITMLSAQVVAARGSCAEHSAKCADRQRLQTVMAILLTHDGCFEDLKPLCAKKTKRKKEKSRSSKQIGNSPSPARYVQCELYYIHTFYYIIILKPPINFTTEARVIW